MGKGKGSDFDPRYWSDWVDEKPCGCGTAYYRSTEIRWVEVRMCSDSKRKWANAGRVGVGIVVGVLTLGLGVKAAVGDFQDITHEAVQVNFKCARCGVSFNETYEIMNASTPKMKTFGHYGFRFQTEGLLSGESGSLPYHVVEEKFAEMWDCDEYNLISHNCKDWSRLMMSKLRQPSRKD